MADLSADATRSTSALSKRAATEGGVLSRRAKDLFADLCGSSCALSGSSFCYTADLEHQLRQRVLFYSHPCLLSLLTFPRHKPRGVVEMRLVFVFILGLSIAV